MGNRLRELRLERKWTHDEAAEAMGVSRGQFIKLERGERRLNTDYITLAAKAFEVPPTMILADKSLVNIMGFVGAGAEVEPEYEQTPPDGLAQVEVPFSLPEDLMGLQVRGDSMLPRYDDGDVVLVYREQTRPLQSLIGEEAAVRTEDGRRFLKTVEKGTSRGLVTLLSWNAKPIVDVRLEWWSEVYLTVRARQLRKLLVDL